MIAFYTPNNSTTFDDLINRPKTISSYDLIFFECPDCTKTINKENEKIIITDNKSMLKAVKQKEKIRNESLKKFKDRF